jgi:hypothetical protein
VCFAEGGDGGLERVVTEDEFFLILTRLSGFEVEDQLLYLSNFKDAFGLANLEAGWSSYLPLGGFFTNVSKNDRFFIVIFYWHQPKVELVGEV